MAALKFARMYPPTAVLILLSVTIVAEEAKRCYWCGPLAEQVHRSQRAPPCGQELQETMCDKGFTHCAVVATSPPYAESRLCVKFYQDECYSLYCNSSKTWRMICPCQGNLCNGQNTDRESKAFSTLAKLVSKNKRSKRSLIDAKGFIITPRKKVLHENNIITAPDNETTPSAMQTDEPMGELIEMMQATSFNDDNIGENIDVTKVEQVTEPEMQGDQPVEMNDSAVTTEDNSKIFEETAIVEHIETIIEENSKNVVETANVEHSETTIKDDSKHLEETPNVEHSETTTEDDSKRLEETANVENSGNTIEVIKINIYTPTMTMLEENNDNKQTLIVPLIKETQQTTEMPTQTSIIPTSVEIELSVIHIQNPTDDLPPPEALQQNVTPAKETAPTTMGTIEISTNTNNLETTTHSIKQITKMKDQTQEIKKKNDNSQKMDEKNGEEQTIAHLWELIFLMNILIYLTL